MSVKRMFSNQVIDTDSFLDLPVSAQCLYFHLGMKADDDGFVSNASRIAKSIGCPVTDLDLLLSAGYLISFPKKRLFVITDFKINNALRADRHRPTLYQEEYKSLFLDDNQRYQVGIPVDNQPSTNCQPDGNQVTTNCQPDDNQPAASQASQPARLQPDGLKSIGEILTHAAERIIKEHNPGPPTLKQCRDYARERGNKIDPDRFFDYYEQRDWTDRNGDPIVDYKGVMRSWERWEHDAAGNNNGANQARYPDFDPGTRANQAKYPGFDDM